MLAHRVSTSILVQQPGMVRRSASAVDPNPGALTITGVRRIEPGTCSAASDRIHRDRRCGPPLTWASPSSRPTAVSRGSASTSGRGTACTTARPARWAERQVLVRVGLLHDVEPWVRRRIHLRHAPTPPTPARTTMSHTVKEIAFKLGVDDSAFWKGRDEAVRAPRVGTRHR